MSTRAEQAIADSQPPVEVAKAAIKDAVDTAETDAEKEAVAGQIYKEATGRFPQKSSDRLAVYLGGFILILLVFVATAGMAVALLLNNKEVPDWMSALATALVSGVVGGLFGYAKQD